MPGFAAPIFEPMSVSSTLPATSNGYPDLAVLGRTAFYGFDYNPEIGSLIIDLITNGTDLVDLPITGDVRDNEISEYKEWIWTNSRLKFSWGGDNLDHLYMEVI